jgi:hypothetical protein
MGFITSPVPSELVAFYLISRANAEPGPYLDQGHDGRRCLRCYWSRPFRRSSRPGMLPPEPAYHREPPLLRAISLSRVRTRSLSCRMGSIFHPCMVVLMHFQVLRIVPDLPRRPSVALRLQLTSPPTELSARAPDQFPSQSSGVIVPKFRLGGFRS